MVITQTDMWGNERIENIAADVAGRAMSVDTATMMMAAHMRELYAYHRDRVDSLQSEVSRLMQQVKALETQTQAQAEIIKRHELTTIARW